MSIEEMLEILESTSTPQCRNEMSDGYGAYCAVGLICKEMGVDLSLDSHLALYKSLSDDCDIDLDYLVMLPSIAERIEPPIREDHIDIVDLNDAGLSFKEIAEVLRYNLELINKASSHMI
jgi:hypothetical protein